MRDGIAGGSDLQYLAGRPEYLNMEVLTSWEKLCRDDILL